MTIAFYISMGFKIVLIIVYLIFRKQINFAITSFLGKKRIQKNLYKACKTNDFLILNDFFIPVGVDVYKKIDTIIFGNKYIYIIKELEYIGEMKISAIDNGWRLVHKDKLTIIDNPLLENQKIITSLANIVKSLELSDLKSMVIMPQGCTFNEIKNNDNNFIVSEKNAVKFIKEYEERSQADIIEPKELERICQIFYQEGLQAEKKLLQSKGK